LAGFGCAAPFFGKEYMDEIAALLVKAAVLKILSLIDRAQRPPPLFIRQGGVASYCFSGCSVSAARVFLPHERPQC
jgi:hypothetical protein